MVGHDFRLSAAEDKAELNQDCQLMAEFYLSRAHLHGSADRDGAFPGARKTSRSA